jgi:hypothetical protein
VSQILRLLAMRSAGLSECLNVVIREKVLFVAVSSDPRVLSILVRLWCETGFFFLKLPA